MKTLLCSFLTPRGRIGINGFWWRQLLLALLPYPCLSRAVYSFHLMYGHAELHVETLPLLLAQACPPCLFSAMGGVVSGGYRFHSEDETIHFYQYVPTGWEWLPGLTLVGCLLLATLAAWCSFALVLRRLRDTCVGVWGLLLCLAYFWFLGVHAIGYVTSWFADAMLAVPVLASLVFTSLPSRREPAPTPPTA